MGECFKTVKQLLVLGFVTYQFDVDI